ncbi:glutamate--cysteine ligase, partial [Streptosporangium sp. NPDC001682]
MGQKVDKDCYSEVEFIRFGERLAEQLGTLREVLARPGFGAGPVTIGAELEMFLITPDGRPLPRNQEVQAVAADDRLTLELGRFNLEANLTPLPIAGRPFTAMMREMREIMAVVDTAAETQGGQVVVIGILPSLSEFDFTHAALS